MTPLLWVAGGFVTGVLVMLAVSLVPAGVSGVVAWRNSRALKRSTTSSRQVRCAV